MNRSLAILTITVTLHCTLPDTLWAQDAPESVLDQPPTPTLDPGWQAALFVVSMALLGGATVMATFGAMSIGDDQPEGIPLLVGGVVVAALDIAGFAVLADIVSRPASRAAVAVGATPDGSVHLTVSSTF